MGRTPRRRSRARVGESSRITLRTHHTARSLLYSRVFFVTTPGSREPLSQDASSHSLRIIASEYSSASIWASRQAASSSPAVSWSSRQLSSVPTMYQLVSLYTRSIRALLSSSAASPSSPLLAGSSSRKVRNAS